MLEIFRDKILSMGTGLTLNVPAIWLNVVEFTGTINVNKILTLLISVLAIIWWLMKIYDQYIITKKRKNEKSD